MGSLRTLLLAGVATVSLLALFAATALAQTATDPVAEAAERLRNDNVYVDPDADPGLAKSDIDRLRRSIARGDSGPVYVAVLAPEALAAAGGDPGGLARRLGSELRAPGTYAVVSGTSFGAASSLLRRGEAGELARESTESNRGSDPATVLVDFVDRVGSARRQGQDSGAARDGGERSGGGSGGGVLALLAALVAGLLGLSFLRRRARRRRERAQLAEVKEHARDDLVALGDDIRALEIDVQLEAADTGAREDYGEAVRCYERASAFFDRARRPEDLEQMSSALEGGRYAMTSARARLEGREPPERRSPCFFDPRHGPSVEDIEWAPPGGEPRPVPTCAADAVRLRDGREPAARQVITDGQTMPYWDAPGYYGPWAGGFFGGMGGGLLPGLLIGSALGGGMGFGHSMYFDDAGGLGDGGSGDGGDFGGDFGGGGDF